MSTNKQLESDVRDNVPVAKPVIACQLYTVSGCRGG